MEGMLGGAELRKREVTERAQCVDEAGPSKQATDRAYAPPLRERVRYRLDQLERDGSALLRVRELLDKHPEFEELIELQNLVRRHGL